MTKKHFIAFADMIKHENSKRESAGLPLMFDDAAKFALANFLITQNPDFKGERWLNYINGRCGSNGGKLKPTPRTEQHDPSDSLYEHTNTE